MSRGEYKYYNATRKNVMDYMEEKRIKPDKNYDILNLKEEVKDKTIIIDYLKKQLEIEEKKLLDLEIKLQELELLEESLEEVKDKKEE